MEANHMPTIEHELLARIRAKPWDEQARLVLADWWMEQAKPEGQLLLWTTELSKLPPADPRYLSLKKLCDELEVSLRSQWCMQFGFDHVEFQSGFAHEITVYDLDNWERLVPALHQLPLVSGIVCPLPMRRMVPRMVELCSQCPSLQSLTIQSTDMGIRGVQLLSDSEYLQYFSKINLVFCRLRANAMEELIVSPYLHNLRSLNLAKNEIGNEGCKHLATAKSLELLTELDLSENEISSSGIQALGEGCLKHLQVLNLRGNRFVRQTTSMIDHFVRLRSIPHVLW
jgi:uncharacterized protein (TIGR02996 family)